MGLPHELPPWWPAVRPTAFVIAWLVCLGAAGARLYHARTEYDTPPGKTAAEWVRPGGNAGHTHIDFGGQWLMGRMIATGHARQLYDRTRQWEVVRAGYPWDREPPAARERSFPNDPSALDPTGEPIRHDADNLMRWVMGKDSPRWDEVGHAVALPFAADAVAPVPFVAAALTVEAGGRVTPDLVADVTEKAVGGPLYPPVHGFLYAPLGLFADPADAYVLFQWLSVGLAFVAGFAATELSRGRVWWPVATVAVLLYPGCRSGLDLGQNPTLTLAVVLGGWAMAARGHEVSGGAVWGLLAFKPVWGIAFFLVPLLMGRWRFGLAMIVTGVGLAAATLPFTGVDAWRNWLTNADMATDTYKVNKNWVELSRDLHGIPRRVVIDFDRPEAERHSPAATVIGWATWAIVVGATVAIYLLRGDRRRTTGLGAGFLFLGAFLGCYHFMYYDALLSAVGIAVLFADPCGLVRFATGDPRRLPFGPRWAGRLLCPPVLILGLLYLSENAFFYGQPRATVEAAGWTRAVTDPAGETSTRVPRLTAEIGFYHPWDTLLILMLWAWCGWRLAWADEKDSMATAVPTGS